MTDLLESTDTPEASSAPSASETVSTPFPPPPPKSLDGGNLKRRRILAIIGGIALLASVVMGLLWVSALGSRDDAEAERDAAQATATEEADRTAAALGSLAATEVELEATRTDNERLSAELAAAVADGAEATAATARADDAEATLAVATVQNQELAAAIVTLEASLAATQTAAEAAGVPADSAVFDINASPDLARYIGEQLSSASRPSVLGEGQTSCLGTAVVNDIGLATLGTGLASGASANENAVVVEAIERAAATCGIDPSAIF